MALSLLLARLSAPLPSLRAIELIEAREVDNYGHQMQSGILGS